MKITVKYIVPLTTLGTSTSLVCDAEYKGMVLPDEVAQTCSWGEMVTLLEQFSVPKEVAKGIVQG